MSDRDRDTTNQSSTPTALGGWGIRNLHWLMIAALGSGAVTGTVFGDKAAWLSGISDYIIQLLTAVAVPFVMVLVVTSLQTRQIRGRTAGKLAYLLLTNTLVAVAIGFSIAHLIRPGSLSDLALGDHGDVPEAEGFSVADQLRQSLPTSALGPLVDNSILAAIVIALAVGIALRVVRRNQSDGETTALQAFDGVLTTLMSVLQVVLGWVLMLVPLAVFSVVASIVGAEGFQSFLALGAFLLAVTLALALQVCFYALRVTLGSRLGFLRLVRGTTPALLAVFSTASSAAIAPMTYRNLVDNVGVTRESASMGAVVGTNFNNDGTALYEAMGVLFIAQVLGTDLDLPQQLAMVGLAILASIGASGIGAGALVTMVLIFPTVGLPVEYAALLLPVDWLLNRMRSTVNAIGDISVSALLDGKR